MRDTLSLTFKESVLILEPASDQKAKVLVLLPQIWAGDLDLARRVYRLASRENADVVYLVALSSPKSTLQTIREMATMTALTTGSETVARYELVGKPNWLNTIKRLYRPQDTIIAPKELDSLPGSNEFNTLHNANRFFIREFSHPSGPASSPASKRRLS